MASAIFIGGCMFRIPRLTLLAALCAAAWSFGAVAQEAPAGAPAHPSFFQHMLQKMDTNGDGRISESEFLAAATARFKSIDTQNKGTIDAAQLVNSPLAA